MWILWHLNLCFYSNHHLKLIENHIDFAGISYNVFSAELYTVTLVIRETIQLSCPLTQRRQLIGQSYLDLDLKHGTFPLVHLSNLNSGDKAFEGFDSIEEMAASRLRRCYQI